MCERQVLAIIVLVGLSGSLLGQVSGVGSVSETGSASGTGSVSGTSLAPPG